MRFLAGVVVGIVIGRPVLSVVNEHLTPPVRRRIVTSIHRAANRLHTYASNSPYLHEEDEA
jgi:hypothetical protein